LSNEGRLPHGCGGVEAASAGHARFRCSGDVGSQATECGAELLELVAVEGHRTADVGGDALGLVAERGAFLREGDLYRALVAGPLSVIVYIHGAGWVFGNAHTHDRLVRELAVADRKKWKLDS